MILGAGAVGGCIAGLLRLQGSDVTVLARGEHARVMKADGLTLATPEGNHQIELDVAASPSELSLRGGRRPDARDQDPAHRGAARRHRLAARSRTAAVAAECLPVVCAQNGVENERLALRRFQRVYGICVMLPAQHLEPGRVEAQGSPHPGMLDIGCYPSGVDALAEEVAIDLSAARFLSVARAEVMRWKYAKLLRNLGNSIEALTGHDQDEAGQKLVRELVQRVDAEGRAVLEAAGIDVVGNDEWKAYRRDQVQLVAVEGRERGGGSSWQSANRGTGSIEADFLNGEIALLGRLHGVATPLNDLLQREANALVRERRPAGSVAPGELLAKVGLARVSLSARSSVLPVYAAARVACAGWGKLPWRNWTVLPTVRNSLVNDADLARSSTPTRSHRVSDPSPLISRRGALLGLGGIGLLLGCSSGAAKTAAGPSRSAAASPKGTAVRGRTVALGGPHVAAAGQVSKSDVSRFGPLANGQWRGGWRDTKGRSGTSDVAITINPLTLKAKATVDFQGPILGGDSLAPVTYDVDLLSYAKDAPSWSCTPRSSAT